LLQRVQLRPLGEALDRGDRMAVGLHGKHRARFDRAFAVEHDDADAAARRVAADVRAGQSARFAPARIRRRLGTLFDQLYTLLRGGELSVLLTESFLQSN
jgi:hypothetical protein